MADMSGSKPRCAILVPGMHRSGTSALTRVLGLCGAALPATLMPPSATTNEAGFWESQPIVDLHDEVLASLNSSWSDLRPLSSNWFAGVEAGAFRARLSALLDSEYGDAELIVVKDPRLCRLLPLWLPLLEARGIAACAALPVRDPREVAASLHRRESFAPARSAAIWLTHLLAAERDSRGLARGFVAYADLLTDWRGAIARLGRSIGQDIGRDLLDRADVAAIDGFLSPGLRHHAVEPDSAPALAPWVATAWNWASAAARGETPPPAVLDRLAAIMAPAEAHFGPLVDGLETDLARALHERQHWIDAAVERYAAIENLRAELEQVRRHAETIEQSRMWQALSPVRSLLHRVRGGAR
ncbi:MAG TPA: hypothetical protein VF286_08600 [Acidiphilium sp.]